MNGFRIRKIYITLSIAVSVSLTFTRRYFFLTYMQNKIGEIIKIRSANIVFKYISNVIFLLRVIKRSLEQIKTVQLIFFLSNYKSFLLITLPAIIYL